MNNIVGKIKEWLNGDKNNPSGFLPIEMMAAADIELDVPGSSDIQEVNTHVLRANSAGELLVGGSLGMFTEERWRGVGHGDASAGGGNFAVARTNNTTLTLTSINMRIYDKSQIRAVMRRTAAGILTRLPLSNLVFTENLTKDASNNIAAIAGYTISSTAWSLASDDDFFVIVAGPKLGSYYSGIRMLKSGATYWDGVNTIDGNNSQVFLSDVIDTSGFNSMLLDFTFGALAVAPDTGTNSISIRVFTLVDPTNNPGSQANVWTWNGTSIPSSDGVATVAMGGVSQSAIRYPVAIPLISRYVTIRVTSAAKVSGGAYIRTIKGIYTMSTAVIR